MMLILGRIDVSITPPGPERSLLSPETVAAPFPKVRYAGMKFWTTTNDS